MSLVDTTSSIPEFSLAEKILDAKVVACYDGDTFYAVIDLFGQFWKFNCRATGYDCPEMKPPKNKPGRDIEKEQALRAKQAFLSHIVSNVDVNGVYTNQELDTFIRNNKRIIRMICKEFDKYGRLLVEIIPDMESRSKGVTQVSINEWMIESGYGYRYNGGTKNITFPTKL
jgi:endonuclease YncB( thermonuclease family)